MDLPTLLAESSVPQEVTDAATELIAAKAVTRELGSGTPPAILTRFVVDELDRAEHFETVAPQRDPAVVRDIADRYFRAQLG